MAFVQKFQEVHFLKGLIHSQHKKLTHTHSSIISPPLDVLQNPPDSQTHRSIPCPRPPPLPHPNPPSNLYIFNCNSFGRGFKHILQISGEKEAQYLCCLARNGGRLLTKQSNFPAQRQRESNLSSALESRAGRQRLEMGREPPCLLPRLRLQSPAAGRWEKKIQK